MEVQIHEPGRPVPVLRDDELGGPFYTLTRPVHLLPIDRQYYVRILFDSAQPAEIVQRRAGVTATGPMPGELRQGDDGQIALHRQPLERAHRESNSFIESGCGLRR